MKRLAIALLAITLTLSHAFGAELVRLVRFKLSAADLPSGIAAVEDYKAAHGVDPEYLDAVGWLARGAEMLHRPDLAESYVAELRRAIPAETPEIVVPLGAAIEVESKLIAAHESRGAAIRFLEGELSRAKATPLRSRIEKNINLLSLEGEPAPPIAGSDFVGAQPVSLDSMRGRPVLLFFWAAGCGDCKGEAPTVVRIWQKYRSRGLGMITATRLYDSAKGTPEEIAKEKAEIEKNWNELYAGLDGVAGVIDTSVMERYGVSATPTFALVDRRGIVRYYTPSRLSEAELSRRIEQLLAE